MSLSGGIRFGIVQGRLIPSPSGQLQWFPQEDWPSEFALAEKLGIDFIELIAERRHNPENPIWSDDGIERIVALASHHGLSLHTFCNDYVIDHELPGNQEVLEQNLSLMERGALLGCEKFILPLFERSELNVTNVDDFVEPLRAIATRAAALGMMVCLETVLEGARLRDFLSQLDHPALSVVYDTGNRVAFGHDLPADIRLLGNSIGHVHIKDKNAANENVILGTGLVNFQHVFEALAAIEYSGPYTFETNRGKNPLCTAAYNIEVVRFFHAESFVR